MTRFAATARIGAILTFVVLLNVGVAFGQQVTGTILGRVTDSTGSVVPGAAIQLMNPETGFSRTEQADADGRYLSSNLPLGTYSVTVQKQGFQTLVRSGIVLTVGSELTINAELVVGDVQQHVEVTGEAPQIETSNATLSGLVSQDQMRDLPLNGRNVDSLVLLSPGTFANHAASVNITIGEGLHLSVNGARPQENLFLLDGTVVNDAASGRGSASGEALGVEGVLEFRLLTHSFSAEYGRNTGAVVSAVTRSGTNQFHGSAYEFIRNDVVDAQNFFNSGAIPEFRRNQFGAAAGGPIRKDRVFFFANYEGLRQRQGNTIVATVPDANARMGMLPSGPDPTFNPIIIPYLNLYPLPTPNGRNFGDGTAQSISSPVSPTTEDYLMVRTDIRLSEKDTFYARYVHDPSTTTTFLPTPTFNQIISADDNFIVLSETHVFSGTSLNEFRSAFNRTHPFSNSLPVISVPDSLSFVPGQPFGSITFASTTTGASVLSSLGTSKGSLSSWPQNLFQESDTFTTVRGAHSIKFGVDLQRIQLNDISSVSSRGNYQFSGGLTSLLAAAPSQFTVLLPSSNNERGWRRILFSAFVQDDFRIRSNLTLNLGLRYEDFTSPREVNGRSGSLINLTDAKNTPGPPFLTPQLNFAPRIGIAWDPTGSGKTSIRAGAGIFYSHMDGYTWFNPATSDTDYAQTVNVTNPVFPNAIAGTIPVQALADQGVQFFSKTPTVIHRNLEIQRQLFPTLSLSVGYVGSGGYHLPRQAELDLRVPQIQPDGTQVFSKTGVRINQNFASDQVIVTDADSNYNGLQVVLSKTMSAGLQFQLAYTYSKAMSDADEVVTGQTLSTPSHAMDSFNPLRDYSLSAYDQRHTITGNWVYRMPWDKRLNSRLSRALLGGWANNGIISYGSGLPFDITSGFNSSFNGDSTSPDRPNLNPGFSPNPINGVTAGCGPTGNPAKPLIIPAGQALHTASLWYDPCAFSVPFLTATTGTYGNLGRNTVMGPDLFNIDFAVVKTTALTEKTNLEFRAEFFNLFNHPNLGLPSNSLASTAISTTPPGGTNYAGNAGSITTVSINNRQIQLGLKFSF